MTDETYATKFESASANYLELLKEFQKGVPDSEVSHFVVRIVDSYANLQNLIFVNNAEICRSLRIGTSDPHTLGLALTLPFPTLENMISSLMPLASFDTDPDYVIEVTEE